MSFATQGPPAPGGQENENYLNDRERTWQEPTSMKSGVFTNPGEYARSHAETYRLLKKGTEQSTLIHRDCRRPAVLAHVIAWVLL